MGSFLVDRVISGTLDELWHVAQRGAFLSKEDFDGYLEGLELGHAILISCGRRLKRPIELSNLRGIWPDCRPPRSFGYIVAADALSRRIMSAFRERSLNNRKSPQDASGSIGDRIGPSDHRGSFFLKGQEVRALLSVLDSRGH